MSGACVIDILTACGRLPLDSVLVAISELLPKIQDSQARAGAPSSKVFNVLKGASLVDVLPPAQPIVPRRFQVCPRRSHFLLVTSADRCFAT